MKPTYIIHFTNTDEQLADTATMKAYSHYDAIVKASNLRRDYKYVDVFTTEGEYTDI